MSDDPGDSPTEIIPSPDERASVDHSLYDPTSRANSEVARELIRKGQAMSSHSPVARFKKRPRTA